MTPYEINLFLHIHTTPAKFENSGNEIYISTTEQFKNDDLIKLNLENSCCHGYQLTDKGLAYLSLLTSIPYPDVFYFDSHGHKISF